MPCRNVIALLLAAGLLAGCDTLRRASYEVQKELGMYPTDTQAPPAQPAKAGGAQPAASQPSTTRPVAAQPQPQSQTGRQTVTIRGATNTSLEAQREAELQRELVAQNWLEERRRLIEVGNRLMRANADICGQYLAANIGLYLLNSESMGPPEYTAALSRAGQVDNHQYVFVVPAGSPVEAAGLRERDRIISIDGWQLPDGRLGVTQLAERLAKRGPLQPIPVIFERNGEALGTEIAPQIGCSGVFTLIQSGTLNAVANGRQVGVTTGMMRFARSDDELATVIAHEMAHNILGHQRQYRDGLREDAAAARRGNDVAQIVERRFEYRQQNEREADYYGLYLAHRAGYAIDGATAFWRRLAIENPRGIEGGLTHPTTADRVVGIENTIAEIAAKQAAGQPLRPAMDGNKVVLASRAVAEATPVVLKPPPPASGTAVSATPTPVAMPPQTVPAQSAQVRPAVAEGGATTLLPVGSAAQANWAAQRAASQALNNQSNTTPFGYREPEPSAPNEAAGGPAPAATQAPAPAPRPAALGPRPAPAAATMTGSATPAPPAVVASAPALPAGYRPSASVLDQPSQAAEQQRLAAATGAVPEPPALVGSMGAGSMKAGMTTVPDGIWRAHLASHRTESAAINEWQELLKSNPSLYGQFDPLVEWVDTQRGPFARLVLTGFADRKAADEACAKIRSSTRYCASVNN